MPGESEKSHEIIMDLIRVRLAVGRLGQSNEAGWWDCNFLDDTGLRFLENIFPRTARGAALRSTTEAACIVHDRALGRVGNYHLFRITPTLENRLEYGLEKIDWIEFGKVIDTRDTAMEALKRLAEGMIKAPEGPVQIGLEAQILTHVGVRNLAAHYHSAFQDKIRCFPYFAPERDGS